MNVVDLPEKDAMKASIDEMKRNFESYVEMVQLSAKLRRATFNAYVDAGFTPDEALMLVKEQF